MDFRTGYDFSGWATRNNLKCADGRIIRQNAFKVNDGQRVPLMWNHRHDDPSATLGHTYLENREEGVYAYGFFNNTTNAQSAKESVSHGDITFMSIWANDLKQDGPDVLHGNIREVSLVPAGANPGARIESVLYHGMSIDEDEDEGILYTGEQLILAHAAEIEVKEKKEEVVEEPKKNKSIKEVIETMSEEQKAAMAIIVGQAIEDAKGSKKDDEEKEDNNVAHNIFENDDTNVGGATFLSHSEMQDILDEAKRCGSLREAINAKIDGGVAALRHSIPTTGMTTATGTSTYGFNDPSMLFPEFKNLNNPPEWISRNMEWVSSLMGAVQRTPFSRIKSVYADITEDDARARGYIKGKQKKEEVFTTLKRTTTPQTIYKKQKLDRDDIIDITDFDVVAWIRAEMRVMLNEEIARAILIGDGRAADSDDKIQEANVRPIANDVPLFNTKVTVEVASDASNDDLANAIVDSIIENRKEYKGSGNPTLFTTETILTRMLMLKDKIGHRIYKTEQELATALRVRNIVTVEVMEGHKITIGTDTGLPIIGIIVNPADYRVGADKGGEINTFEDFDIDYNQHKYLIETRISGALIKPFAALTFGLKKTTSKPSGT